jgi:ribosome biogenesis ATPase
MVAVKAKSKPGLIQRDLDNKVYNHILQLLDDKTDAMAKSHTGEQIQGQLAMALARDLPYDEILQYVRLKDKSLGRMKMDILSKSIERTWEEIKAEEAEELGGVTGPNIDDFNTNGNPIVDGANDDDDHRDGEMDPDAALMVVKDLNLANKNIVSLWGTLSQKENTTETDDQAGTKKTGAASTEDQSRDHDNDDNDDTKEKEKESKTKKRHASGKSGHHDGKKKRAKVDRSPPKITLSSLGGLDDVFSELMEVVGMPMLHPEIYLSTGIQPPRGVLLHGPPGCGKTTIANALAGDLKVSFINISAPSVVSGMSGESEKKVRELFDEAKALAPCLIFIDEIDAITPKRDGGAQREMERRIVAQLLTCMDELTLENTGGKPVIVIGATNRPDSLDAALRRAGRFDREISINVPGEVARMHILESMTAPLKISGDLGLKEIAKMTPGFVGADLKALVTSAGVAAIKRIFSALSDKDGKLPTELEEALSSDMDVDVDADANVEENDNVNVQNNEEFVTPMTTPITPSNPTSLLSNTSSPQVEQVQAVAPPKLMKELSVIQKFLAAHPNPLTAKQLEPLSITRDDFLTALPTIQPTAMREGFATVPDVSWANVGALSHIRIELHMAIVQPIKRPEVYLKVGISAPAGVLMWGPPGCGKTLLAKAVANESKANFISVKGPELLNKYVGESERSVRQVFARARASVPCIIFFDELDALVPRRDTSLSESSSRVVNTLLTELDGLNNRKGIFVIGATNRPDMIDPAMLRPGRLDKTLYIELPSANERVDILKTLIKSNGTPIADDVNLETIAHDERCRNFSGADLSSLVREASVIALKRKIFVGIENLDEDIAEDEHDVGNVFVTAEDFSNALDSTKPSVGDRDRAKYEKLNKRLGWDKTNTTAAREEAADS